MSTTGHVLVVEDSIHLSEAFRIMLERSGFRVSVANTIADALAIVDVADVLLLDLSLPDGDGVALLGKLTKAGRAPKASIALTGHDDPGTRTRCINAGCVDVLVKPVAVNDLVDRVRSLIA